MAEYPEFSYSEHGANIGSYCPFLKRLCAWEDEETDNSNCPHPNDELCEVEDGSLIITESGRVVHLTW